MIETNPSTATGPTPTQFGPSWSVRGTDGAELLKGRGFGKAFTAALGDIDELGHVNNAVWVRWIQDMATAHWAAQASPEHIEQYIWVVVRHEIDYRGNLKIGESVEGRTWIEDAPTGAKFDRHVAFVKDGKTLVQAKTTWAIIDKTTQRILRVPKDVSARFLGAAT